MIIPATSRDVRALLQSATAATPPLDAGEAIAPAPVLEMLAGLAASIEPQFAPAAWRIIDHGATVGLCSLTRVPSNGVLDIGYGIARVHHGKGIATRAVSELVRWAVADDRVRCLTAETAVDNIASQRVLERNAFIQEGERVDPDDGPLLAWRHPLR